jgi:hypothetical protein
MLYTDLSLPPIQVFSSAPKVDVEGALERQICGELGLSRECPELAGIAHSRNLQKADINTRTKGLAVSSRVPLE